MVYCNNIDGLIKSIGLEYDAMEWRIFIDSSCRSLKAVLLYNENNFSSIPIGQSVQMKKTHDGMDYLLSAFNYQEQKWLICDLKVVGLVLKLQSGYTKHPCFLCLWDIQADDQHYVRQEWPLWQGLRPGSHKILSHPLIEVNKYCFHPYIAS